jgi:hypothetical protein
VDNLRNLSLTRTTCNRLLACGRAAAEADDVAIRVVDIEALRAPLGRRDRLDDRHAVGDALLVERLDGVNGRGGVEMFVVAPVLAVPVVSTLSSDVNLLMLSYGSC